MDLMSVHRPDWFWVAIAGTWIYTVLALALTRYGSDARLVVAVPILGNLAVGSYAAFELLQFLAWAGQSAGRITRVAGVAEALIPAFHGAIAGTLLSCVVLVSSAFTALRQRRSRAGSMVLVIGAGVFVGWVAFMWYLVGPSVATGLPAKSFALSLCASATVLVIAMLVLAVRRSDHEGAAYSRTWFLGFTLLSAMVGAGLRLAEYRLYALIQGA